MPNSRDAKSVRLEPLVLAILVVLAACLSACSRAPDPAPTPAPSAAPASAAPAPAASVAEKPKPRESYNVVFILIDSLRADMPWTGYSRQIAPRLTKLAEKATLYPRAYSLSSYTAKSVAPALTGLYPSSMRRDGYFFTHWYPENVFVNERAQQAGHRTLAGHGHGYFLPNLGMDQGFDDYRLLPGTFLDVTGVHDVTSEKLNQLAKEMLSDPKNVRLADGKRFFAYFHFLDPHYTYIKHPSSPDWGNTRRDLYDNEVHFTDHWVGDLMDWALAQPWAKETAFIISADHGEGLGERGHYRHAYELWESLVRVPLFVIIPGAKPRRIEQARSHIDLAPTIIELMGLETAPELPGKSLVAEVFGGPVEERPVLVDLPRCDLMDRRRALVEGDYKLISFGDDKSFMLFDVKHDFAEENELSKTDPSRLEKMKTRFQELWSKVPITPVVGGVALMGAHPSQRF